MLLPSITLLTTTTYLTLTLILTLTSALTIPSLLSSSLHLTNLTSSIPNIPPDCHPPSQSLPKLCIDDCLDALLVFTLNHPLPTYTLTHSRLASSDTIQCPHVTPHGSCQLRIDYGRGEGQVVNLVQALEPRVLELVEKCVDGKGWGWGGIIGGIDDGGDAVIWVEETEGWRGGAAAAVSGPDLGPGACRAVMGNGTAVGHDEDVVLAARDNAAAAFE